MNIRQVQVNDLPQVVACNLYNLSENYPMRFWTYMILNWPDLSFLAENESGKIVGYVLSSIEPAEDDSRVRIGHINSLSVLRPYRRLGLAQKLMNATKSAMLREDATIQYLQLHVRKSNKAARSLYDKLGYRYHHVENKYYTDDEDALTMRFSIQSERLAPQRRARSSSNTRRWTLKTWITGAWGFVRDKCDESCRFAGATIALVRGRRSHP